MTKVNSSKEINDIRYKTILVFTADWCVPCSKLKPEIEKLKFSINNVNVDILYIDIDDELDIAEVMKVYRLPTISLYDPSNIDNQNKITSSNISDVRKYLKSNGIEIQTIADTLEFDQN